MADKSLMEEMLDVLQTENVEYKKLFELSEQKTDALIKSDITQILAISEKEQEVFQTEIDNLEVDKYVVEINDDEWDKVKFGSITINN